MIIFEDIVALPIARTLHRGWRALHVPANHVSLDFSISETGLDPGEKFEELVAQKILKRSFEFTIEFIIRAGSSGKEKFGRKMVLRDSEGYYWRDRFIAGHAISVTNDSARDNTERFCFVFEHFFSLPQRLAESGIFFFFSSKRGALCVRSTK